MRVATFIEAPNGTKKLREVDIPLDKVAADAFLSLLVGGELLAGAMPTGSSILTMFLSIFKNIKRVLHASEYRIVKSKDKERIEIYLKNPTDEMLWSLNRYLDAMVEHQDKVNAKIKQSNEG